MENQEAKNEARISGSGLNAGVAAAMETGKQITLIRKDTLEFYADFSTSIEPALLRIKRENSAGYAAAKLLMVD